MVTSVSGIRSRLAGLYAWRCTTVKVSCRTAGRRETLRRTPRHCRRIRMTERLYYTDARLTEFTARVLEVAGERVYLDRTAFYPTSGGQQFDTGTLGDGARGGRGGRERADRARAGQARALLAGRRTEGRVDWTRRFDHMQQHTGQHLLSAVFEELFGHKTVSVHFGDESATLDLDAPSLSTRARAQGRAARERDRVREPAGDGDVRGFGVGDRAAQRPSIARANCGSSRSRGSTGAHAAGRTCAAPARSARSRSGASRSTSRRRAWSSSAAGVRWPARARTSTRSPPSRARSPRRSTKCPRSSRRRRPV